jgi:hypothetical protein
MPRLQGHICTTKKILKGQAIDIKRHLRSDTAVLVQVIAVSVAIIAVCVACAT